MKEKSLAEKLHESYEIIDDIEEKIFELFETYEPDISKHLRFHIGSDYYDNSIEIYITNSIPYPYEPSYEVRKGIYDMGFDMVYWNFTKDNELGEIDEIRGWEPRRCKSHYISVPGHGYVDTRFDINTWKYNFKEKIK